MGPVSLPLELWRRLDWRFLLPELPSGPIVCAGRPGDDLRSALPLLGSAVHHVTSDRDWDAVTGTSGLVVLVDPTPSQLGRAVAACRPGGWVYAEVRRSLRRFRGPRTLLGWRRAFAAAGLESATAHWHARDIATCSRIIPVDAAGALRHLLGEPQGIRFGHVLAAVGLVTLQAGLFPAAIPEGSVIGRRPGPAFGDGDELH